MDQIREGDFATSVTGCSACGGAHDVTAKLRVSSTGDGELRPAPKRVGGVEYSHYFVCPSSGRIVFVRRLEGETEQAMRQ